MKKKPDKGLFLEISPYEADCGQLIGKDPRQILLADIRQLEIQESPLRAIRAKCTDCSGGNIAEVRKCVAIKCCLWPYRMGSNPFHASSASSKREAANLATSNESGPVSAAYSTAGPCSCPEVGAGDERQNDSTPTQNEKGSASAPTLPSHGSDPSLHEKDKRNEH